LAIEDKASIDILLDAQKKLESFIAKSMKK